jgi:polyketide cyclase/dehydrase/lipid transport protein
MPEIHAISSAVIPASHEAVYRLIADYRNGHPLILPPAYFQNLIVEAGGVGAGTIIQYQMRSFGTAQTFRAEVSEPEPGRRLIETDVDSGAATVFTVEPEGVDGRTRVTIETRWQRTGVRGWVERWLAPGFLRRVYQAQLVRLAEEAQAVAS